MSNNLSTTNITTPDEKNITLKTLIRKILARWKLSFLVDIWDYAKRNIIQFITFLMAATALYVSVKNTYYFKSEKGSFQYQTIKEEIKPISEKVSQVEGYVHNNIKKLDAIQKSKREQFEILEKVSNDANVNRDRLNLLDTIKEDLNNTYPYPIRFMETKCNLPEIRCIGAINETDIKSPRRGRKFEVIFDTIDNVLGDSPADEQAVWIIGDFVSFEAQRNFRAFFRHLNPKPLIYCTKTNATSDARRMIQVNLSKSELSRQLDDLEALDNWWSDKLLDTQEFECEKHSN